MFEHITCHMHWVPLTNGVVPSVHGKYTAAGDSDHSRYGEMGQGVGGHMRYWRIGRKLQHHDDILLHLVLEHERTLWKETLLSRREKRRSVGKDGGMWWWERRSTRKEEEEGEGAGRQGMEKMKRRGMKRWEKKNGKRQLVWRLEEKLGSDTDESFMHSSLWTMQSDEGLIRQG